MHLRFVIKILLAVGALPFMSMVSHAEFRVCNTTEDVVGVAIGYRAPKGWVSEGWWKIEPTSCKTIIEGPLSSRFYYLHAEDAKNVGRWKGEVNMCLKDSEFEITGVDNCLTRGFQKAGFQEIDTGTQTSWMVQLTEQSSPNPALTPPLVTGNSAP